MEILYLENNTVILNEEAKSLPCIQSLIRQDRSEKLLNFQNIITGVYFIYKPDGLYENLSQKEREVVIYEKGHISKEWSYYSTNKQVKEFIDVYCKTVLTKARRFLESIKKDMDEFLEHLSSIPMEKKVYFDQNIEFEHEGNMVTKRIQRPIKIPNIEEKQKAYSAALKISEMYEKQKAIVNKEMLQERTKKAQRRQYDKRGQKTPFNV